MFRTLGTPSADSCAILGPDTGNPGMILDTQPRLLAEQSRTLGMEAFQPLGVRVFLAGFLGDLPSMDSNQVSNNLAGAVNDKIERKRICFPPLLSASLPVGGFPAVAAFSACRR
jgi:hypothetical protein